MSKNFEGKSDKFPRTNTDREIIREAVVATENTALAMALEVGHHEMMAETIVYAHYPGTKTRKLSW